MQFNTMYLVNELTAELIVLFQDLVPQVTVHTFHNVSGLDLEQTAHKHGNVNKQGTPLLPDQVILWSAKVTQ